MPHNTAHDLAAHRRESTTRRAGPLFSYEPLAPNRERKPQVPAPKKRRRPTPPTPALSFNPQNRLIPNGRHDPSASAPTSSKPATVEAPTDAYEQQTTSFGDRELPSQFHDEYDAQGWSHILDSSCVIPSYPENDMNPMVADPYDSPASHTSSSSPAPSDQSPRTADFVIPGIEYAPPAQPSIPVCQGYVAVHQGPYGFSMDTYPDQGYPVEYIEPARGRPGLHGGSPCPGNNSYQYPNSRRS